MRLCVFYIDCRGRVYRPYGFSVFDFAVDSESLCLTFRRTRFVGRPPLSHSLLRRRFAPLRRHPTPLRGASRRPSPPRPSALGRALRAQAFGKHEVSLINSLTSGKNARFLVVADIGFCLLSLTHA